MKSNIYCYLTLLVTLVYLCNAKNETGPILKKQNVTKCCPYGKSVVEVESEDYYYNKCVKPNRYKNEENDFNEVPLYNKDKTKTGIFFGLVYHLYHRNTENDIRSAYSLEMNNCYLSEKGILYREAPNEYHWWIEYPNDKFCIDYSLDQNSYRIQDVKFWNFNSAIDSFEKPTNNLLINIGLFVSSFFLFLTLIVYWVMPGKRVLSELVQITYVASTMGGFFFLSMISIRVYTIKTCLGLSYVTYFLLLASFCWMVVMSFDLWSLHSNKYSINRTSKSIYVHYSIFGWGVPAAMTCFLIIMNNLELKHIPWFIKPNIPLGACFIEGGEKWLYLYIPMLILILSNWALFLSTSYNLWKQYKMTSAIDQNPSSKSKHRSFKNRFLMYLKLSIIMGISWVLEVVSYFVPGFGLWYITDCYNLLSGFSLFLILVCNKRTFEKLKERFSNKTKEVSVDTLYLKS